MAEGSAMRLEEAGDLAAAAPSEAVEPSALHAAVAQYRLEAFHALQHRHALNASILGIFEGAEFTVEQLAALVASHEAMTRRFGEALVCLVAVVGSEGTA